VTDADPFRNTFERFRSVVGFAGSGPLSSSPFWDGAKAPGSTCASRTPRVFGLVNPDALVQVSGSWRKFHVNDRAEVPGSWTGSVNMPDTVSTLPGSIVMRFHGVEPLGAENKFTPPVPTI
jgi:hypothetical protein